MNIDRKTPPVQVGPGEFSGCDVTITTNVPLEDPNAELRCVGDDTGCVLRIVKSKGCTTVVQLHEDIALFGAGHYEIILFDGCDECDRVPVKLNADCYITSITKTDATKKVSCNEC